MIPIAIAPSDVASDPTSTAAPIATKVAALSANATTAHARSTLRVSGASPHDARSTWPIVIAATTVSSTPESERTVAMAYVPYT